MNLDIEAVTIFFVYSYAYYKFVLISEVWKGFNYTHHKTPETLELWKMVDDGNQSIK